MTSAGGERRSWLVAPWTDIVLACAVGVAQIAGTINGAARSLPHARHLGVLGVILLAATPAALLVRRRWPVQVYAVALAASVSYQAAGYPPGAQWLGLLVAFVTVLVAGYRRIAAAGLLAAYVLSLWLPPLAGTGSAPSLTLSLGAFAWLLVVLGAVEWLRLRRLRAAEAARLRLEEARRRVTEERLQIARELHDVLAQNISLINVQAATTLFQLDGADERAVRALSTIKDVSHETLQALRSVLGALRDDRQALRTPAPSISRLDGLIARVAEMGVTAKVELCGAARPLPPGVDLAAYRILQEALTNVARHSRATTARVELSYGDADLVVQVDDDGQPQSPFAPGTGITGMTERVTALGGRFQAGPRPEGGFRVRACLPLEEMR